MERAAGPLQPRRDRDRCGPRRDVPPAADAAQLAGLATEALVRAADPAQVDQLRLVLRLLEYPVANALGGGRLAGLSAMSPADRERLLLRWAHSPLALKRSAFQAFRKLLSFLAYAAPGPDGAAANPLARRRSATSRTTAPVTDGPDADPPARASTARRATRR